ncbi:MAG: acyl carrier protein [Deltaproteobacteria bacterium]|nr:MAG: acyl carrier protein [Deltaproteobacteria bacterium]
MTDYHSIRSTIVDWLDDNYHFGDTEDLLTSDEISFMDHAILDSLGFVQLILFLENTFHITLERKDLTRENFDGMKKIIDYLTQHPDIKGTPK